MSDATLPTDENPNLSASDLSLFSSAPAFEPALTDIWEKWQKLATRICDSAALYYAAQSAISDVEYDEILHQLQQLEEQ